MDKSNINAAIIFSDIAGSSLLYKQLGDDKANTAISRCVAMMSEQVRRHHGVVVKTIGDEVMARFESAEKACAAGIAIQLNAHNDANGLNIRIGAAYGTAILKNNDVFGEVVNDAAAIARVAKAHQFLVSQAFANEIGDLNDTFTLHPFDKIAMKGSQQISVIHRVDWEPSDVTFNATQVIEVGVMPQMPKIPQIDITYLRHDSILASHSVKPNDTPFCVGREKQICKLAVPTTFASRDHFNIEHRRGKFILTDRSTNGTYIKEDGTETVYLRREEMPLRGSGIISMGQPPGEAEHIIRFQCVAVNGDEAK